MQWIQTIMEFIFDLFFGCRHNHLTRPFTLQSHSYKICLDCGQEMPYSLEHMRLLRPWEIRREPKEQPADIPATVPALVSEKSYADWKAVA